MTKASTVTVAQAIAWATSLLPHSDSAQLDAQVLLLHVLQKPRSFLYSWPDAKLTDAQSQQFKQLLQQRIEGHPVAHLIGEREFWSLPLTVSADTLIPRPDTEAVVEACLGLALPLAARVLDLGTGSGAIALALAHEQPNWSVTAIDASERALHVAKNNARRLGLERVEFLQGSWFEPLSEHASFDLIVSNPPYIDEQDPHLQQGDVRFEPLSALVANDSGYADLFEIAETAPIYMKDGGWLVLEHGYQQAQVCCEKLRQIGYQQVSFGRDLAGQPRFTLGYWPAPTAKV
ncbi:peptide chain release factor N(5)-glutamine methyltransferase [Paraferrimonas haliotis]|uniref:Release factor glutamine methyltransferase n=1 Tax=Paraferrimonas haliotis TaxID=2013866 RepID=A0AA37TKA0_9GAMM|nr:peptide chain release factor N(5)-glutamine methyltransferase [Paraferrimonas haliotis]GLS82972.1 release factor glutamine methyltransferase [Paraferrimonas haliotis]